MKKLDSVGSFVLISPISFEESTYTGLVVSIHSKGSAIKDDVVLYHIDDVKIINYNGEKLHAILYYNIIAKFGQLLDLEKEEFFGLNEF